LAAFLIRHQHISGNQAANVALRDVLGHDIDVMATHFRVAISLPLLSVFAATPKIVSVFASA
jgi:hypothetical protein